MGKKFSFTKKCKKTFKKEFSKTLCIYKNKAIKKHSTMPKINPNPETTITDLSEECKHKKIEISGKNKIINKNIVLDYHTQ